MFFLIQSDIWNADAVHDAIILDVLKQYRHDYKLISIHDFFEVADDGRKITKTPQDFADYYRNAIPVGGVDFIRAWLRVFKGIPFENAIEVPPVLRTDEFLKRKYSIVPVKDIPRTGQYFIKDATEQKRFLYKGDMRFGISDEMFLPVPKGFVLSFRFDHDHLYQVSEIVNILSEYRVYVLQGDIRAVTAFDGNPLVFPDTDLIRRAVDAYSAQPDSPRSFSLDIMVTPRGTAITEVHNFASLGLYTTLWDDSLLYALKDGIDYIINHNTPQTEFSNFDTYRA